MVRIWILHCLLNSTKLKKYQYDHVWCYSLSFSIMLYAEMLGYFGNKKEAK